MSRVYLLLVDLLEVVQVSAPQIFGRHQLHRFELGLELLVLFSQLLDSLEGQTQELHVEQVAE